MMGSREIILAVLIAVIALGLVYMLDPTLFGLIGAKHEGFTEPAAPRMAGEPAGMLAAAGAKNEKEVKANPHNATPAGTTKSPMEAEAVAPFTGSMSSGAMAVEGFESLAPADASFAAPAAPANCYPKNQLVPSELLPADANSAWAQVNPTASGDIAGKNFLSAGALVGVDTVGQSNRNANWDLRAAPPNPQMQVSPWMQSTIAPDLLRRPLDIA